jgi:ankyrin repeat protein
MHLAASQDNAFAIVYLNKKMGMDYLESRDNHKNTVLHLACMNGSNKALSYLVGMID